MPLSGYDWQKFDTDKGERLSKEEVATEVEAVSSAVSKNKKKRKAAAAAAAAKAAASEEMLDQMYELVTLHLSNCDRMLRRNDGTPDEQGRSKGKLPHHLRTMHRATCQAIERQWPDVPYNDILQWHMLEVQKRSSDPPE